MMSQRQCPIAKLAKCGFTPLPAATRQRFDLEGPHSACGEPCPGRPACQTPPASPHPSAVRIVGKQSRIPAADPLRCQTRFLLPPQWHRSGTCTRVQNMITKAHEDKYQQSVILERGGAFQCSESVACLTRNYERLASNRTQINYLVQGDGATAGVEDVF